jgi:hypothetical protein
MEGEGAVVLATAGETRKKLFSVRLSGCERLRIRRLALGVLIVEIDASSYFFYGILRELLRLGAMSTFIVLGGFQFSLRGLEMLERGAHVRLIFGDKAGRDEGSQQGEHKNPRTLLECFHSFAPV